MQHRRTGLIAVCVLLASTNFALSAAWQFDASGRNSRFSWSSVHGTNPTLLGQVDGPWMGSPIVTTDGVFFNSSHAADPMNFVVDSNNPQKQADERWVISTVAKPPINAGGAVGVDGSLPLGAPNLEFVRVVETGTYVSDNPLADFTRNQSVFVTIFDPFGFAPTQGLDITFNPDGTWIAVTEVDLLAATFGQGAKTIQIDLTNILNIATTAPSTASITKTSSLIIIPEPASAMFAIVCASFVVCRRRRHAN